MSKVYHGDCFDFLPEIPDGSIDMALCDLPYGITKCKWDSVLPLDKLWKQYKRIVKPGGAIVLTANQPFTTTLISSNIKNYRHCWVWDKVHATGFQNAKHKPMMKHEDILVFSNNKVFYYPVKIKKKNSTTINMSHSPVACPIGIPDGKIRVYTHTGPTSIIRFKRESGLHPTQKPVTLFAYLIKTYTQEGETVLDNCAGSGTTAIAAIYTGRKYILMEKEDEYIDTIRRRIRKEKNGNDLCDLYAGGK